MYRVLCSETLTEENITFSKFHGDRMNDVKVHKGQIDRQSFSFL